MMNKFSERLKDLRHEKGLSQRDLAKATDLSQSAIVHWENQTRIPSAQAVVALAKFFGVTTDYLLGLEEYCNFLFCFSFVYNIYLLYSYICKKSSKILTFVI